MIVFHVILLSDDHSRVVLDPLPSDPHSDYINASYIYVSYLEYELFNQQLLSFLVI